MDFILGKLKKALELFNKLNAINKTIAISMMVLLVMGLIASFLKSKESVYSMLFDRSLTIQEYATITQALEKMQVKFKTRSDKFILVKDEEVARTVRMKLAQGGYMPSSIKSWEIFDMNDWTTTEFDRNIKLRRALIGQIKKHLESLDWIEGADVSLNMPKKQLYTEKEKETGMSVSLTPSPGYRDYLKDKKKIKGIEMIIVRGVDGLNRENVVITDDFGIQLNDFSADAMEERLRMAYEERKIINKEKLKIKNEIYQALLGILTEDRYRVVVDIDMNFDKESEKIKEILPVVVKERTPGLPYDDSQVVPSVKVSEKENKEEFKGQGYIPEGPPGQENNIPPGYKDNIDRWNHYNKNEKLNNYTNGERNLQKEKDTSDIVKKSVAVIVDGTWKFVRDVNNELVFEGGGFKREYIPYAEDDLLKIEKVLEAQIGFDKERGDQIVVKNIKFDRRKEFALFDKSLQKEKDIKKLSFLLLIVASFSVVLVILFKLIRDEMKRRARKREIEQEMERQREVEESLKKLLEDEAVDSKGTKSDEILEGIIESIDKNPEMTAKVLKSWILE